MRSIANIIGPALVGIGLLWALQGQGLVGGSFMTGQSQWLYIGIATIIVGAAVFIWNIRRRS